MFNEFNGKAPSLIVVESNKKPRSGFETLLISSQIPYLISSPESALQAIFEFNPKVIIVDLFLPGWNSLDLLKSIHLSKKSNQAKVLAVSSMDYKDVIDQVMALGVDKFLKKPVDKKTLLELISEWLKI